MEPRPLPSDLTPSPRKDGPAQLFDVRPAEANLSFLVRELEKSVASGADAIRLDWRMASAQGLPPSQAGYPMRRPHIALSGD